MVRSAISGETTFNTLWIQSIALDFSGCDSVHMGKDWIKSHVFTCLFISYLDIHQKGILNWTSSTSRIFLFFIFLIYFLNYLCWCVWILVLCFQITIWIYIPNRYLSYFKLFCSRFGCTQESFFVLSGVWIDPLTLQVLLNEPWICSKYNFCLFIHDVH